MDNFDLFDAIDAQDTDALTHYMNTLCSSEASETVGECLRQNFPEGARLCIDILTKRFPPVDSAGKGVLAEILPHIASMGDVELFTKHLPEPAVRLSRSSLEETMRTAMYAGHLPIVKHLAKFYPDSVTQYAIKLAVREQHEPIVRWAIDTKQNIDWLGTSTIADVSATQSIIDLLFEATPATERPNIRTALLKINRSINNSYWLRLDKASTENQELTAATDQLQHSGSPAPIAKPKSKI